MYTMQHCTAERRKWILPLVTGWVELENILLSEICQVVREKCHIISTLLEHNQELGLAWKI